MTVGLFPPVMLEQKRLAPRFDPEQFSEHERELLADAIVRAARKCLKKLKERREPIVLPLAEDTGCRKDELVKAERRQFDKDRKQLTIRRKGNQVPTISLSDAAWRVLCEVPPQLRSKWLFTRGKTCEPYKNASARFNELVKAAQKAAQEEKREFRPMTLHHLLHFYAVWFLKNGGNIYTLQQHLDHKSITTTELNLDFLTPEEAARHKSGTDRAV